MGELRAKRARRFDSFESKGAKKSYILVRTDVEKWYDQKHGSDFEAFTKKFVFHFNALEEAPSPVACLSIWNATRTTDLIYFFEDRPNTMRDVFPLWFWGSACCDARLIIYRHPSEELEYKASTYRQGPQLWHPPLGRSRRMMNIHEV